MDNRQSYIRLEGALDYKQLQKKEVTGSLLVDLDRIAYKVLSGVRLRGSADSIESVQK